MNMSCSLSSHRCVDAKVALHQQSIGPNTRTDSYVCWWKSPNFRIRMTQLCSLCHMLTHCLHHIVLPGQQKTNHGGSEPIPAINFQSVNVRECIGGDPWAAA